MRVHVQGAINNGVTTEQIREILIHAAIYCGIPAAVDGFRNAFEVLDAAEAGIDVMAPEQTRPRVGFVGLGHDGVADGAQPRRAPASTLIVRDADPERAAAGLPPSTDVRAAAAPADFAPASVVVTMLPDDRAVAAM